MNIQPSEILQKVHHPEHGLGVVSYVRPEDQTFGVLFPSGKQLHCSAFENGLSFVEPEPKPIFKYKVGQLVWIMPDKELIQCEITGRSFLEFTNDESAITYRMKNRHFRSYEQVDETFVYPSIDTWIQENAVTMNPQDDPNDFYFPH